ncbi:MAG: ATP-binding cassette domain-containing protein [Betaproteobacteria bacterium]
MTQRAPHPTGPLLVLDQVHKRYRRGVLRRRVTFSLAADMAFDRPEIVGVLGPNGAGKTTLFEMIAGSNVPSSGRVVCAGQDMNRIKPGQRDRLAIHYHQSYQVRKRRAGVPSFLLDAARSSYPQVHLFDEPQFNTQDGYIGFMLDFFRKLRAEGRLVFICLHPTAQFHISILREICERFLFVGDGRVTTAPDLPGLCADPRVSRYLGKLSGQ